MFGKASCQTADSQQSSPQVEPRPPILGIKHVIHQLDHRNITAARERKTIPRKKILAHLEK